MPVPETHNTLVAKGYTSKGFGQCRSFRADVIWYITPTGKWMPYDRPDESSPLPFKERPTVPHWSTCPNSSAHKAAAEQKRRATEAAEQPGLFTEEVAHG